MNDQELRNIIPFVVWTSEYDMYQRDCLDLAKRGRSCGKLLDFSNMPGVNHGYQMFNFDSTETKAFYIEEKLAFDTFVRGTNSLN